MRDQGALVEGGLFETNSLRVRQDPLDMGQAGVMSKG
jgi:hypothetical protein